jgi:hypothetical protein
LSANGTQLTLAANVTTATIRITPVDDPLTESSETVTLSLASGTGYTTTNPTSASGSITDNDVPAVVSLAGTDTQGA